MASARAGFGLVQTMVAAGVMSSLMLGTTALLSHTQRTSKSVQMSGEWTRRADLARAFLSNQETCTAWITGPNSFQQASVSFPNLVESVPSTESEALQIKRVSKDALEIYVHDKAHDGVLVTDIKFWKVEEFGPSSFLAQVVVKGKKLSASPELSMPGLQTLRSDFYLQVQLTSAGTFQSCQGTTVSDACAAMGGTFEVGASPECVVKQFGIAETSAARTSGLNRLNSAANLFGQSLKHGLYAQGAVLSDSLFRAESNDAWWLLQGALYKTLPASDDFGPTIGLQRARGSRSAVENVVEGDVLGSIVTHAYSGGKWSDASDGKWNFASLIQVKAGNGWNNTSHPTDIHFHTTPAGSNNYGQAGGPAVSIRSDQSLAVKGAVKIGAAPSANCDAASAGTTRYHAGLKALELCNGSEWKPILAGAPKLQCLTGGYNGKTSVFTADPSAEVGLNGEPVDYNQVFLPVPYAGGEALWGLRCTNGWAKTGCSAAELKDDGQLSGDVWGGWNGCFSDDEELSISNPTVFLTCCRAVVR
jgi:hypothetical protein